MLTITCPLENECLQKFQERFQGILGKIQFAQNQISVFQFAQESFHLKRRNLFLIPQEEKLFFFWKRVIKQSVTPGKKKSYSRIFDRKKRGFFNKKKSKLLENSRRFQLQQIQKSFYFSGVLKMLQLCQLCERENKLSFFLF